MNRFALKQAVKNTVYASVAAASQLSPVGAVRRMVEGGRALRVLMYHKVNDLPENPPCVPPSLFEAQMEHLRARFQPVSLEDLLAMRRGARALPERAVLVTFDDGYRDNLLHAAPVLARLGIPALIFLPIDLISSDRPLPHDEARHARGVRNATLTWEEAARLRDYGFTIGSHGRSHRIFSRLPDEEAAREIRESKAELERRFGVPVRSFAYVNGAPDTFTPSTVQAVKDAGYEVAFATRSGPEPLDHLHDPFAIRRYNVEPFTMYTFRRLLEGDCDLVGWKDSDAGLRAKRALDRMLGTGSGR